MASVLTTYFLGGITTPLGLEESSSPLHGRIGDRVSIERYKGNDGFLLITIRKLV
jgi:hypothetical protein